MIHGLEVVSLPDRHGGNKHPAVLLIHGNYHAAWCWDRWMPAFVEAGYAVHALSLRGHGGSQRLGRTEFCRMTTSDHVADIKAILKALAVPCILIGHSLGGLLAQAVAAEAECDRVPGLVLIASAASAALPPTRAVIKDLDAPVVLERQQARQLLFHDIGDAEFEQVFARLEPASPGVLNSSGGRLPVAIGQITCPIMIISARWDRSSVPSGASLAALFKKKAHFIEVEAGHDLMLEDAGKPALDATIAWIAAITSEEPISEA